MRTNFTELLFLLATAAAAPATPSIHRCVAADGAVSYQSAPCAAAARQDWVRTIGPVAAPVATRAPAPPSRAPTTRVSAPRAVRAGPDEAAAARRRCDSARRDAAATRERLWNKLGFRERSELDAAVARACAR